MDQFLAFAQEQWILFAALFFIVFLLLRSFAGAMVPGINQLKVHEAIRLMNDQDAFPLDVRLEKEFKGGHIANACHIPLGALDTRVREIEKHKEKPVLVHCQSGNRSMEAAKILKKHGFTDIYNLSGGLSAWSGANLPLTKK